MTDFQSQGSQPEQTPISPTAGTMITPPAAPPKESGRNLLIIIGALVVSLCLCTGICGIIFGIGIFEAITEKPKVESVIDEFMSAMVNKDANKAYALFSTRAKRNMPLAEIEKLLDGNNYALFDGYRGVTITNLNLNAAFNTDPDIPQGTVAKVEGTISYEGGFTGAFNAVLEQEGDEWRLFGINVTVPPDKFNP